MRTSATARILAITIASVAVGGGAAAEGASPGNSAVGSALNHFPVLFLGPGTARLNVAAHSDAGGLNPRGEVKAHGTTGLPMGEFHVQGPVTCLLVDGNKAAIKYRFDQATGSAATFKGGGVEVFVEDNGPPRGGQPVDAAADNPPQPAGVFQANESQCDDPKTATYST